MGWGGKARIKSRVVRQRLRTYHATRPENPHGVPREAIRALAALRIPNADRETYSRKLAELLGAIEKNGD
jgi:hypothetical protein